LHQQQAISIDAGLRELEEELKRPFSPSLAPRLAAAGVLPSQFQLEHPTRIAPVTTTTGVPSHRPLRPTSRGGQPIRTCSRSNSVGRSSSGPIISRPTGSGRSGAASSGRLAQTFSSLQRAPPHIRLGAPSQGTTRANIRQLHDDEEFRADTQRLRRGLDVCSPSFM
jgi:hypothetical protein